MKIVCYASTTRREKRLVESLVSGFKRHGESIEILPTGKGIKLIPGCQLAVFVGVRRKSRTVYKAARKVGMPTLMLDKGYFDRSRYHRFSFNSPQPVYIKDMTYDDTRLRWFRRSVGQHTQGKSILYIESTQKYYDFHGLGSVEEYSDRVCKEIKRVLATRRGHGLRLVHRPRVSLGSQFMRVAVADACESVASFASLLRSAYCVITHGSNAGIEAFASGVPVISLGSPEVNPVHDLVNSDVGALFELTTPSTKDVWRRLSQLAWCQYNHDEVTSGFAWEHLKPWMP